jgi:hypothetical protein
VSAPSVRGLRLASGVAAGVAVLAFGLDRSRLLHAYLVAFGWLVTTGLGALFFILLHHLTRARWSLAASRRMGRVASVLPWCALLFLPLAVFGRDIFPWAVTDGSARASYFARPFFLARAAVYLGVWSLLAIWLAKEPTPSENHRRWSGPAAVVFGVTVTFAGFDWFMSLQSGWQSTIFGVYVFAGAVTASLGLLALLTIGSDGIAVGRAQRDAAERHDIGKLIFGFVVFWAYIAFSQYLLIWYAAVPHETAFYRLRLDPNWRTTTFWLGTLHFAVPFLALLSGAAKRSPLVLGAASVILLLAHWLDLFWLAMPALDPARAAICPTDVAAALIPLCTLLWAVALSSVRRSPVPALHRGIAVPSA